MDTGNVLQVSNLACVRQPKQLFANLSFQLTAGQVLLVEGPNGSGKSSLLRLLTGLATPHAGHIAWNHQPIHDHFAAYTEQLHYLGHANGIKLGLTVEENLRLAKSATLQETSLRWRDNYNEILSLLALNKYAHTLARHLSAGQKRRIGLARIFLCPKSIWILDEPFTALDISTQAIVLLKLQEHLQRGGICIASSHHPIHLPGHDVQTVRLAT